MSQETPTKYDRFERHLMRQRGAGNVQQAQQTFLWRPSLMISSARSVAVNFGFSFTIAVPASNQSDDEQPPAKRRRTIKSEETQSRSTELETAATETNFPVEAVGEVTETKRKPRRKLPTDIGEETLQVALNVEDDSFIAKAKSRSRRKIQTGAREGEPAEALLDIEVGTSTASGKSSRPRRRAATATARKIAERLAEEAPEVNKKQRKVGSTAERHNEAGFGYEDEKSGMVTEQEGIATEAVAEPFVGQVLSRGLQDKAMKERSPVTRQAKSSRGKRRPTKTPILKDGQDAPTACRHPNASRRQILTEVGVNLMRPSLSPEKHESITNEVLSTKQKMACDTERGDDEPNRALQGRAQRHATRVSCREAREPKGVYRDTATDRMIDHLQAVVHVPVISLSDARGLEAHDSHNAALSKPLKHRTERKAGTAIGQAKAAIDNTGDRPPRSYAPSKATGSLPSPPSSQSTTKAIKANSSKSRTACNDERGLTKGLGVIAKEDKEEDIDWLFAAGPNEKPTLRSKRIRVQPMHNMSKSTKDRKRQAETVAADMDLDDLVSNIAMLAG